MSLTELELKPELETSEETKKWLEKLSNIEKRAKANDNYDNELNLGLKRAAMFVLKLEEKNVSIEKYPLPDDSRIEVPVPNDSQIEVPVPNDSQIEAIPLPNVMIFESEVSLCWSFQLVITFWEDEVRVMGYQKGTEYIKWPYNRTTNEEATTNNEEAEVLEMIIEKFLTPQL